MFKTFDMDPIDVDPDGICANQTTPGAANLLLNGALTTAGVYNVNTTALYSDGIGGTKIAIDSAGDVSAVVFTVTGTDQDDVTISETITGVTTTAVNSTKFYKTITSIAAGAAVGSNVFVGPIDQLITKTVPLNWRNDYTATFVVGDLTGTCQYDIEETNSELNGTTSPTSLVWAVSQSNKTANLAGSLLNYSTAVRLRFDSYSSGAELQFSVRQNDY